MTCSGPVARGNGIGRATGVVGSGVGQRDPRRTDVDVAHGESMPGVGHALDADLWEERVAAGGEQVRIEGLAFGGNEKCHTRRLAWGQIT